MQASPNSSTRSFVPLDAPIPANALARQAILEEEKRNRLSARLRNTLLAILGILLVNFVAIVLILGMLAALRKKGGGLFGGGDVPRLIMDSKSKLWPVSKGVWINDQGRWFYYTLVGPTKLINDQN